MSTPTIPDLVTHLDPRNCGLTVQLSEQAAAEINARHRERMAEVIKERDEARDDLKQTEESRVVNGRLYERALSERDDALAEIERLKLDNAILNGRLIERTDCMLTRQRESLDEARRARSIARRALEYIDSLADLFTQLSKDRRYTSKDREAVAKCADRVRENADVIRSDLAAAGL